MTTETTTKRDPLTQVARYQARRVEKLRASWEASKCKFTGSSATRQKELRTMYLEARRALSVIQDIGGAR